MTYVSLQDQEFTVLIHEHAPQLLHVASSGVYSCGILVPPALFHVVLYRYHCFLVFPPGDSCTRPPTGRDWGHYRGHWRGLTETWRARLPVSPLTRNASRFSSLLIKCVKECEQRLSVGYATRLAPMSVMWYKAARSLPNDAQPIIP